MHTRTNHGRVSNLPASSIHHQSARVLVAATEFHVRETAGRWLDEAGYQRNAADTVTSAWELQQQVVFDLVVTDLGLSEDAGIELLRQIKQVYPQTPVLVLTSNRDVRLAIQALTEGAYGYLLKPIERSELLFYVERSLERRRLLVAEEQRAVELQRRITEQTRNVQRAYGETTQRLLKVCLLQKGESPGHIQRVGQASALVAQALGWSRELVESIRIAAQMHDVGQIGVPDVILQKPGRLTERERAVMQRHTTLGARFLAGSLSPVLQMAEQIAHYHHEHWDGTGYPASLSGQQIPTAARIVAIVDVYDALTHDRVFRRAFPESEVLAMLNEGIGTQFDPTVAYAFFDVLPAVRMINELGESAAALY